MRKTYSRAGFTVAVLYGVMSVVSGMITGVLSMVGILLSRGEIFGEISGNFLQDFNMIMDKMFSGKIMDYVILGMVLGSFFGMLVGLLIVRNILPAKNNIPIEKKNLSARDLFLMILMGFGLWGIGAFIGNLPDWFGYGVDNPIFSSESRMMIFFNIYAVLGAPVMEELAFRKLLLDAAHPYGEIPAIFLSALLFGLMHGNAAQFLLAFSLGLMLAAVYMRTGRVIYTILMHFLINLTATIPDFFALAGIDVTVAWYIGAGTLTVVGLVMFFLFRRKVAFFDLSESAEENANAAAFRNPGMRVAVIGGLVLLGGYEALLMFSSIMEGYRAALILRVIPIICTVVIVILTLTLVGKDRKKAAPAVPETSGNEASEPLD